MGKGDIRTQKGKLANGTYGHRRSRKKSSQETV
ncbi:MAG: 30S ribosomal protein THX [Bacteroidota bacterium]